MIQKTIKEIVDRRLNTVLAPNVAAAIGAEVSEEVITAVSAELQTVLFGNKAKAAPKGDAKKGKKTTTGTKAASGTRTPTPGATLKMKLKKRLYHTKNRQENGKPAKPGDDIVMQNAELIADAKAKVADLKKIEAALKNAEKAAKDAKKNKGKDKPAQPAASNGAQTTTKVTVIPGLSPDAPL
jgi:hypothetical protein